ncbi:hypothetical protein BH11BAC1_BH11BAC1_03940 [soil metagenome]
MFQQLKNIASLQFGIYYKPERNGDLLYLQNTNFNSDRPKAFLSKDTISPSHLLQDGDILIIAKGSRNTASVYSKSTGDAVASSLFFIIRLENKQVLPEFLAYYLNDSKTQSMLKKLSGATTVPTLSKKDLMEISIPIPSLHQQKQIVSMMNQWEQEKNLTQTLIEKKDQLYASLFNQLIQK